MCLSSKGEVFTWGAGGRLGRGEGGDELRPLSVTALAHVFVAQVAAGHSHCACVTREGDVWSWGTNSAWGHGEGLGSHRRSFHPEGPEGLGGSSGGSSSGLLGPELSGTSGSVGISPTKPGSQNSGATSSLSDKGDLAVNGSFVMRTLSPQKGMGLPTRETSVAGDKGEFASFLSPNTPALVRVLAGKRVVGISCGISHTIALCDAKRLAQKTSGGVR